MFEVECLYLVVGGVLAVGEVLNVEPFFLPG